MSAGVVHFRMRKKDEGATKRQGVYGVHFSDKCRKSARSCTPQERYSRITVARVTCMAHPQTCPDIVCGVSHGTHSAMLPVQSDEGMFTHIVSRLVFSHCARSQTVICKNRNEEIEACIAEVPHTN